MSNLLTSSSTSCPARAILTARATCSWKFYRIGISSGVLCYEGSYRRFVTSWRLIRAARRRCRLTRARKPFSSLFSWSGISVPACFLIRDPSSGIPRFSFSSFFFFETRTFSFLLVTKSLTSVTVFHNRGMSLSHSTARKSVAINSALD